MNKYDYGVKFPNEGTTFWAFQQIKPESRVLEFGSSNGLLTRHLKCEKNCTVDIVEINEDAGKEAAIYADNAIIGSIEGNINNNLWHKNLSEYKYDCILFLDVLEHLYDPKTTLTQCIDLLSEQGEIYISVPNIAHNGVILSLIANHFEYQPLGILDDTHIRFFAEDTLEKMVTEAGLSIVEKSYVRKPAGNIEIRSDYSEVDSEVARFLQRRGNSEIFQFMYRLSQKKVTDNIKLDYSPLTSTLYFDFGDGYSEANKMEAPFAIDGDTFRVEFQINEKRDITSIRWDPFENQYAKIEILSVSSNVPAKLQPLNAMQGDMFYTTDPMYNVEWDTGRLEKMCICGRVKFVSFDDLLLEVRNQRNTITDQQLEQNSILGKLAIANDRINILDNELVCGKKEVLSQSEMLDSCNKLLQQRESELSDTQGRLQQRESELSNTQGRLQQRESELSNTQGRLQRCESELLDTQVKLQQCAEALAYIRSTRWWRMRVYLSKIYHRIYKKKGGYNE